MDENTRAFLAAARAMAVALKDYENTSLEDGNRLANAFVDAYNKLEGLPDDPSENFD